MAGQASKVSVMVTMRASTCNLTLTTAELRTPHCKSHAGAQGRTCSGGAQACVLYTMRSSATASTWPGEKQGSAFSPPSDTPAAAAASRTCANAKYNQHACTMKATHLLVLEAAFSFQHLSILHFHMSLVKLSDIFEARNCSK